MQEFNEYWLLKKVPDAPETIEIINYRDENIVELTADGIIFVWPKEPDRSGLCQYCDICPDLSGDELEEYIALHCQPPEDRMQPCPFVPADDCDNQDIDDYMADGSFFAAGTPYYSLSDYLKDCNISRDQFRIVSLGYAPSIRSIRLALLQHPEMAAF